MLQEEQFLLDFHQRHPGCTSRAFATGKCLETGRSSYELLSCLAHEGTVLDLGCGDGHLLELLAQKSSLAPAIGIDFSAEELAVTKTRSIDCHVVRGRGQRLPFASASVALVLSHFAFHLMSDLDRVVDEIGRVLQPGGRFAAIVGGGPRLGDAFELFLELLHASMRDDQRIPRIGARQARTEQALSRCFGDHPAFEDELTIDDYYIDFGGTFDEVWTRLSTVYDLMHFSEEQSLQLRNDFQQCLNLAADEKLPCTMMVRRVLASRVWS